MTPSFKPLIIPNPWSKKKEKENMIECIDRTNVTIIFILFNSNEEIKTEMVILPCPPETNIQRI